MQQQEVHQRMYYTSHCAYFQLFRASGSPYHSSQSSLSSSVERESLMTGICERLRALNLVALPHFNAVLGIHM